jgi:hypothetical protein
MGEQIMFTPEELEEIRLADEQMFGRKSVAIYRGKEYYYKNRERLRKKGRDYYAQHKDSIKKSRRQRREENAEQERERDRERYRARKNAEKSIG